MRLWHYDILSFLPKGQLLAQWRELNSIYKKSDQHILINYIYEYGKEDLLVYTKAVIEEMQRRNYRIKAFEKMDAYFENVTLPENINKPFERHHNDEYLEICYFNLKEKFIRGQKDYDQELYDKLHAYYLENMKEPLGTS